MSFTIQKKTAIEAYILEKINDDSTNTVQKTEKAFGISSTSVYRYINKLIETKKIEKTKNGEYSLICTIHSFMLKKDDLQDEDKIYKKYMADELAGFKDDVLDIWRYSFCEMMNNVIDHSQAQSATVIVKRSCLKTSVIIADNGIGIFRNIKDKLFLDSLDDAVKELFIGKVTTDRKNHSGEGIFFTSKALDSFAAISDNRIFTHNKSDEILSDVKTIEEIKDYSDHKGTIIFMELSNTSNRKLKETFNKFEASGFAFTKTVIRYLVWVMAKTASEQEMK